MPIIINPADLVPWYDLALDMRPYTPECLLPTLEDWARRGAQQFFARSYVWRSQQGPLLTTVAGQASYTYTPPGNAELLAVHSCWNGGTEVSVADQVDEGGSAPGQTGKAWTIGVASFTELRLDPAPTVSGVVLHGTLSYLPARNAAGVPRAVYERWRDGITAWAVAELVKQPAKTWTNPGLAPVFTDTFKREVRRASNAAGPIRRRGMAVEPV